MRHTATEPAHLLDVLQLMHPDASRKTLRGMLDSGRVQVNGQRERRAKRLVAAGDEVAVKPRPVRDTGPSDRIGGGARVLYEDAHLMAVEKPHGMLTIATDKGGRDTLYDRVFEREKEARRGGRIFIVHRLDRPTSGIMLFARSEEVKDRLQEMFAKRKVERFYHAVVEGLVAGEAGRIDARLAQSDSLQVYVTPSLRHGKAAETHWKVLRRGRRDTLVEVRLGTGKRHQIRVHMAHIGHPVVGDKEHGAKSDPFGRLGLHAARLEFAHPVTGAPMRLESPTPKPFLGLVRNAAGDGPVAGHAEE